MRTSARVFRLPSRDRKEKKPSRARSIPARHGQRATPAELPTTVYRDLADGVADVLLALDRDLLCAFGNKACENLLGIPAQKAVGKGLKEILHSTGEGGRTEEMCREVLESGSPLSMVNKLERDGRPHYFEINAYPSRSGLSVLIRDVTERRQVERTLEEATDRMASILASISDGFFTVDDELVVTFFNAAAGKLLGRRPEEVLHKHLFEEAFPEAKGSMFEQEAVKAVREPKPIAFQAYLATAPYRNWYDVRAYPFRGGFSVYFRVITEQMEAEERMRLLESGFRNVADSIIIAKLSEAGALEIVYANPAFGELLTAAEKKVSGDPSHLMDELGLPPDLQERIKTDIPRGEYIQTELTVKRKSGAPLYLDAWFSPIKDQAGRNTHLIAIARDVSERKQMEQTLAHNRKMEALGKLAGGIAHDFNNLLTVIGGYSDMALESLPPGHPTRSELTEIGKATKKATNLTGQLLAFSRKQVMQPRILDPNQLVRGMEDMLRRLIGENIELAAVLQEGAWNARADPGQIEQVIMNLVINAKDAMPDGGRLTIETKNRVLGGECDGTHLEVKAGEYAMIAVSDTGIGMDAETLSRIFEPFFTTKEKGKGTGLGLPIAYGIVKQSDGCISCSSEPGKGTTFKVYLPRTTEQKTGQGLPETADTDLTGRGTVLLVEDEQAVRDLARTVLEKHGYTVFAAPNGGEALKTAARHRGEIDLLLSDMVMPMMSGVELAERIIENNPGMKILFISGYTEAALAWEGKSRPGAGFLQKPFVARELARRVKEILKAG